MTTTITCPTCGTTITVEPAPARCACCGREIQGRVVVGDRNSGDYEGKPLCAFCAALGPIVAGTGRVGPSEVKGEQ